MRMDIFRFAVAALRNSAKAPVYRHSELRTSIPLRASKADPVPEELQESTGVVIGGSDDSDLRLVGPFTLSCWNCTCTCS